MIHTTSIRLSGITCGACQKVISQRLNTIEGVREVHVKIDNGDTTILALRLITPDEVIAALQGTHYKIISNS